MLRLGVLVSVFCLCFSSYSLAYDPQYSIGSTGPNGGTVTSVDVTQTLIDTAVNQVGDFQETQYTYKYTETVVEDITTTNQITTTTYESVVKSETNLQLNSTVFTSGGITDSKHYNQFNDFHTDYRGGSATFDNQLSEFMTKEEINTGFDVTAGAQVNTCTNRIGGHCSSGLLDTFSITIKVLDPTTGFDQQKTTSWAVGNSLQTYSTTLNVTPNDFGSDTRLLTTYYGIDNGYWGGYYGPNIIDPYIHVTYESLTQVMTTIEQSITSSIQSAIDTIESQIDKKYNPIVQPGTESLTIAPPVTVEEPKIEIKMQNNAGDTVRFDVKVETTASGAVEVSIVDAKGETQIAEIKPIESTPSTGVGRVELKVEPKAESKSESKNEKSDDKKEADSKGESKTVTVADAKQKIAERILQQVLAEANQIMINDTKLGLMIALADTENFAKYQARQNADLTEWYNDKGIYNNQKDLPDPYAVIFNLAQDRLMTEMENKQYDADFGKGYNIDN